MRIYIKNMVCNRCILVVKQELEKLRMEACSVTLGEVDLLKKPTTSQLNQFKTNLNTLGFELLDDSKKQLIEKIKNTIIQHIQYNSFDNKYNFSEFLSKALHKDYSYLSSLFSEVEGITIEKYVIHQKIEKVKELLIYDELSLSEIAFQLGYSSVAHLSSQFKKVIDLTPSHFKQVGRNKRKPLDSV